MRECSCCFTGHRNIPYGDFDGIKEGTRSEIVRLIENGVTIFIAGGALGYDTLCANLVLEMKEIYSDVELRLALPCRNQTRGWAATDIDVYNRIIDMADCVTYVSENYDRGCMFKRNRYMADNSAYCLAYCTKREGGSFYTVEYAKKCGSYIVMI